MRVFCFSMAQRYLYNIQNELKIFPDVTFYFDSVEVNQEFAVF